MYTFISQICANYVNHNEMSKFCIIIDNEQTVLKEISGIQSIYNTQETNCSGF